LVTLLTVVVLAAVLGWVVAGRALRPVHVITAAARTASEDNLSARVTLRGPRDELQELAETFNDMLARLQLAFESQRRFIGNASHELRTPLAVMRTSVDVVADNPASTKDDLREMALDIRSAVDRADDLIAALLLLARNERGLSVRDDVDLATVVEDVLDLAHLQGRHIRVQLKSAPVTGDPILIEHLVTNLIDNAVRYNIDGGEIWVSTELENGNGELIVSNTGPVVSADDVDRIFQPFQRLANRTSHEGFGLGLTIVESIVSIHDGRITATPQDAGGLLVKVWIPFAPVAT
jgi:signal transduction histidine kinase